jgi:hypothetical protein
MNIISKIKYIAFLFMILASCSDHANKYTRYGDGWEDISKVKGVYGRVKSIIETRYSIEFKFGEWQKEGEADYTTFIFDKDSRLTYRYGSLKEDTAVLKYDGEGKLIERVWLFKDGTAFSVYEYSDENKRQKETNYSNGEKFISVSTFDKLNNLVELNLYTYDGSLSNKRSYEYDSHNNLVKEALQTHFRPKKDTLWVHREYDSKNNLTRQYNSESNLTKKDNSFSDETFQYAGYDKRGNWLKQSGTRGNVFFRREREIAY